MKLSIIIPIYNTEKYLPKCIESCLDQDISSDEYEIILINDGSTDGSHFICEQYQNNYKNIKYFWQENAGQSVARNNGVQIAAGSYVWFIDSDDYIKTNCLSYVLNLFLQHNLDILRIGYKLVNFESNTDEDIIVLRPSISILNGRQFFNSDFVFGPPLYIYKKNYLESKNLAFYPNIYHEDNEFTPRAIYYAEKIGQINSVLYYIYLRPDSTTRNINPNKNCNDILIVCQNLIEFSHNIDKKLLGVNNDIISNSFNSALNYALSLNDIDLKKFKQKILLNKNIFKYMLHSNKTKYKIQGLIFIILPGSSIEIYKIAKKVFA